MKTHNLFSSLPFHHHHHHTTGYVSGETIHINGYVKNFSKVTIRHTKIVLLETINYLSRGKIIGMEKREIASLKGPKIRAGSRDEFANKKLYIPPLPPTNIRNSNLIQLNYDVYVSRIYFNNNFFHFPFSFSLFLNWKKRVFVVCRKKKKQTNIICFHFHRKFFLFSVICAYKNFLLTKVCFRAK